MRTAIGWTSFLISTLALGACAPPGADNAADAAEEAVALVDDQRPTSVPRDYVVTPSGYFHPSCVVHLGIGERVGDLPPCAHPSFEENGRARAITAPPPAGEPESWKAYSHIAQGATWLASDWWVPAEPKNKSNQIIYLFNGLTPSSGTPAHIVQPVLQWTKRNKWEVQPYDCCLGGNTVTGPAVKVKPGDVVTGYVTGTGNCRGSGTCDGWTIGINVNGGFRTSLDVPGRADYMSHIYGGVLETYNVDRCDKMPPSGGASFSNINVFDVGTGSISPLWDNMVLPRTPQCVTDLYSDEADTVIYWTSNR